jgi:hypothetical protein
MFYTATKYSIGAITAHRFNERNRKMGKLPTIAINDEH